MEALVKHSDVNAVAVVARFPDDEPEDSDCYREGKVKLLSAQVVHFIFICMMYCTIDICIKAFL